MEREKEMPKDEKTIITVCMGSSCFARGNAEALALIEETLQRTGAADRVELRGSRCENKCAAGPHIRINGATYSQMRPEELKALLNRLAEEA